MSTPICARVERVHRVLGVDERADAAELLRLGEHVVDERRLARGLGAEDLDDPPARHAADSERQIQRQRAGRDRADADLRALVAHAHDAALAELALDLRQRALERGVARLSGLFLIAHRHPHSSLLASPGFSAPGRTTSYARRVREARTRRSCRGCGDSAARTGRSARPPFASRRWVRRFDA